MLTFLTKLFTRRDELPPHFHTHLDHNGRPYLCDESICRPQTRGPLGGGALLPPLYS